MNEMKLWYAVQRDSEDDWGTGSYDKDEAIAMCKEMDCPQIAVIEESTHDAICVDIIYID